MLQISVWPLPPPFLAVLRKELSENEYEGVPVNSGAIKDLYDNHATYFWYYLKCFGSLQF